MGGIIVRRIRPDEWPELRRLRLEALQDSPLAFGSTYAREAAFHEAEWRRRALAGAEGIGDVVIVAAMEEGPLVGMARGSRSTDDPGQAYLIGVYVTPAWRGRGLARATSVEVIGWARQHGFRRAVLHVADWNASARRLYESLGFVATGATEPLPHDPSVTEIEMRLGL